MTTILGSLNEASERDWDKANKVKTTGLCPPSFNTPLDTQEGGDHYKNYVIQPLEYTLANNLNFCQGNVIKYITRYKDKNGAEDLRKARHYINILIEGYNKIEREERKYEEDNGIY